MGSRFPGTGVPPDPVSRGEEPWNPVTGEDRSSGKEVGGGRGKRARQRPHPAGSRFTESLHDSVGTVAGTGTSAETSLTGIPCQPPDPAGSRRAYPVPGPEKGIIREREQVPW